MNHCRGMCANRITKLDKHFTGRGMNKKEKKIRRRCREMHSVLFWMVAGAAVAVAGYIIRNKKKIKPLLTE